MSNLTWYLDEISEKEHAFGFIRQFEHSLCVFSPLVGQLYGSYEILPANQNFDRVVVLPQSHYHHDIYSNLLNDALLQTPFFLMPSSSDRNAHLSLAKREADGRLRRGEFNRTMSQILTKHKDFVPVLNIKQIKQVGDRLPIVPVHHLRVEQMQHISRFSQTAIKQRVKSKLLTHFDCA